MSVVRRFGLSRPPGDTKIVGRLSPGNNPCNKSGEVYSNQDFVKAASSVTQKRGLGRRTKRQERNFRRRKGSYI